MTYIGILSGTCCVFSASWQLKKKCFLSIFPLNPCDNLQGRVNTHSSEVSLGCVTHTKAD